jgi:hypothetical protein
MKSQLERSAAQEHTPPLLQACPRTERKSCLPDISSGWLDIIAMSELPEAELAGVGVDAPPQGPFPPGDVRRHQEAPGHSYRYQSASLHVAAGPVAKGTGTYIICPCFCCASLSKNWARASIYLQSTKWSNDWCRRVLLSPTRKRSAL